MIRKTLALALAAALLVSPPPAVAQEEAEDPRAPGPWKSTGLLALGLNQSSFSANWAGSDNGNVNWVATYDGSLRRQVTRKFLWSNLFTLKYGQRSEQVVNEATGERTWTEPQTTNDQIQVESIARFTLEGAVDPYGAIRWDSQFVDETNPRKKLYVNPNRFQESVGVGRAFYDEEERNLLSRLGVALVQNVGRSFPDPVQDDTKTTTTHEGGLEWTTDALWGWWEGRLVYRGQLFVFLPLLFSDSDELKAFDEAAQAFDPSRESVEDFWRTPSVNYQNTFDAKVTEWLAVNLFLQLVYQKYDPTTTLDSSIPIDEQIAIVEAGIRKAGQFKQTLAIALTYRHK